MSSPFFSSHDFSVVSLMLIKASDISDDHFIQKIDSVVLLHPGKEEVLLGGLPYVRYSISADINKDLAVLLPIALLLMILMLYASFKEWKGVLLPFIVVIMSLIFSFGIMSLLGWQISLISVLLPIMLIAIANDYGIHMIARYQELARGQVSPSMIEICRQIYRDLKRPIIVTALTTIGGILGLLTHTMVPAAQMGVLAALGIGYALILSMWFLPAVLSYLKPINKVEISRKRKFVSAERWLQRVSKLVTIYPRQVVIASAILGILGAAGIYFIKVDTNIEGYFLGRSKVSRGIDLINNKLGGSQFLSILFSGEVLSPELLNRMDAYETVLEDDPAIGDVSSPVTLIKELSKGFYNSDEKGYGQIPTTVNEVYQFIEIFSMGGNEEAVEQFIDYNYENSRILVRLKDGSNEEGKRLLKKIQELTKDDPDVKFIAGPSLTKIELAEMVVKGQITVTCPGHGGCIYTFNFDIQVFQRRPAFSASPVHCHSGPFWLNGIFRYYPGYSHRTDLIYNDWSGDRLHHPFFMAIQSGTIQRGRSPGGCIPDPDHHREGHCHKCTFGNHWIFGSYTFKFRTPAFLWWIGGYFYYHLPDLCTGSDTLHCNLSKTQFPGNKIISNEAFR